MTHLTIEEVRRSITKIRFASCLEYLMNDPNVTLIYVCSEDADMAEIAMILAEDRLPDMKAALEARRVRMVLTPSCPLADSPPWAQCGCSLRDLHSRL